MRGELYVVGTGILAGGHLTAESESILAEADDLFYLVADPATAAALVARRPDARSLAGAYAPGVHRARTYAEIVRRVVAPLERGRTVCAAFYGHPGVFASAPHAAIALARARGHEARMLPSVSAEDCLAADLELDFAAAGCQSFEASDFLLRPRRIDPRAALVLWQIGAIGVADYRRDELWSRGGLALLGARLAALYGERHHATLYEAAQYAVCAPRIESVELGELGAARASVITTLCVPPVDDALGSTIHKPTTVLPRRPAASGTLSIVGLGYGAGGQVTRETRALVDGAERLFYLVSDATTAAWLRARRRDARSLAGAYRAGEDGAIGSRRMVRRLIAALDGGRDVCAAFSGHPALWMHTSHAALAAARRRGHEATFYPAVSCEDLLFADLGIDPAPSGRLLFEATDFLARRPVVDPTALLLLLQVGAIGERRYRADGRASARSIRRLALRLSELYPSDRPLVLYRSARLPWLEPEIERTTLARLPELRPAVDAMLAVLPAGRARRDARAARLIAAASPPGPSAR